MRVVKSKKRGLVGGKKGLIDGKIFGISIFGRGKEGVLKKVEEKLKKNEGRALWIATVNPEFVMEALKDRDFMKILLEKTTINAADGVGLVWARETLRVNFQFSIFNFQVKILKPLARLWLGLVVGIDILKGKFYAQLASGADLIDIFCKIAAESEKKVFFLGGWSDRGEKTKKYFLKKYPKLKALASAGRPEATNEEALKEIKNFRPDILFVAYGMKSQEKWIEENLKKLEEAGVKVVMGVGRSFDYYSGELSRAPAWVRRMGFEWLYSLIKEPKRWRRQIRLVEFIWRVIIK